MKACELCGARYRNETARCPLDGGPLRQLNDPLIGRTIAGRYVLTDRIGSGGMGTVYRARHEVVGRDVAVKFLAPQLATRPLHRTRFLREARAANRINHEHIIDITDCGETSDGLVYLVMEFLDGVPMSSELRERGPLPVRRALLLALQLARALGRAHDFDVVHRDIKPDNLYLLRGYDGDFVKILDFGLAHMRGELRLTASGTVFGTPEYMSPEQVRGAPATFASDLYALGVVMFEMLTGAPPFVGSTHEVVLEHMRTPPPSPASRRPGLPPEVDHLVLRLLAKSPDDRPRSAHALAEELKLRLRELPGARALDSVELPSLVPPAPGEAASAVTKVTQIGTGTVVAAWQARVAFFAELAERAHGDAPPAELARALARLSERVERMAAARGSLARRVAEASQQEEEARESRLRIGRALEALQLDVDRLIEEIDAASGTLRVREQRCATIAAELQQACAALPSFPVHAVVPPEGLGEALRRASALAEAHEEAREGSALVEEALAALWRQHEDLEFQVGQLKGRMAILNAGTEVELDTQREQTAALDQQLEREIEEVARESAALVDHFLAFPELREMVRAAGA